MDGHKPVFLTNLPWRNSAATTPPSLLGIDRKIAYANRKYHSGLI